MTPVLRPMTGDDIGAVLGLERSIFPDPWTDAFFRDELAAPLRSYLVAEEDGEIIGYGGVMLVEGDAHITNLAVAESSRGRGAATRLFLALAEGALDDGAEHLTLEVRIGNLDARRLYSKFGFAPVAVHQGFYPGEDALIMWAIDASGPEYRARLDEIREGLR